MPWRALLEVEPWEVQRRLLHQLWSERAALKHHWPYDKQQWHRVSQALESAAQGRPVDGADTLADLLHTEAARLYALTAHGVPEDVRPYLTRSVEEWRLFAQLLSSRDSDGARCWGPRPPGDVDRLIPVFSAGAVRFLAGQFIRVWTTRIRDRFAALRSRGQRRRG
jgi:hypothetical protein